MKYRSDRDRAISVYAAMLIITIFGAGATMLIVHVASKVNFSETNLAKLTSG